MRSIFAILILTIISTHAAIVYGQDKPKEFALYLLPLKWGERLSDADLKKLKKPVGQPLISGKDVEFYHKDRHELGLYYTAGIRLRKLGVNHLDGRIFAVFIGNDPIYTGAFWPSKRSASYDGVNIDTLPIAEDHPKLKIGFGYPEEKYAKGADPRADTRLFKAFEDAKMLRQELVIRGKCTAMRNTMKRRASVIFTFTVDSVEKGDYKEKEIEFETYSDGEGGKLLRALESRGSAYGGGWTFDREKQLTLKFEQRTDLDKQPYWFWFLSVE